MVPLKKHRPSRWGRSVKDVPKPMNSWKVIDGSITKETSPGAENIGFRYARNPSLRRGFKGTGSHGLPIGK